MTHPTLKFMHDMRDAFGQFEFRVTTKTHVITSTGYPKVEPQNDFEAKPWNHEAKHKLHNRIVAWRARK